MEQDPFKEYIKETEPEKRDKGYAWHTAIGLQAVDGLRPSKYLIDTSIKNIEGDISIDEAGELLNSYYEENPKSDATDRAEEADKVSLRIVKILSEKAFSFTPNEYISIHRKLFTGIYSHAGMLMYGREAQSKTRIASPATIPKSGERNRKIHSCMLYLISI
jgi:hypothetical protein